MLDFCIFTGFGNMGSMMELYQSFLADRDTKYQTENS